ncbi:methyltransferase domain-containing protein [Streptomyces sp. NPDC003691]
MTSSAFPAEHTEAHTYVFADSGARERDRLRLLARLLDPLHQRALSAAGIREGLHCLEVGSGTGSMAVWMAQQVGVEGSVLATDINLSFLGHLEHPNIVVRELDVVTAELPLGAFDVITCSAVLHHLPRRESVVERLARALKPDGVLVLVEPDADASVFAGPEHQRFWSAWCRWGASEGIDFRLGRALPRAVRRAGLELQDMCMEVPFYAGGSPWDLLYRATVEAAGPRLARWDGPDLVAEFDRLPGRDGHPVCSLGWVVVTGRAPGRGKRAHSR